MKFRGHNTFAIRRRWISKRLKQVQKRGICSCQRRPPIINKNDITSMTYNNRNKLLARLLCLLYLSPAMLESYRKSFTESSIGFIPTHITLNLLASLSLLISIKLFSLSLSNNFVWLFMLLPL